MASQREKFDFFFREGFCGKIVGRLKEKSSLHSQVEKTLLVVEQIWEKFWKTSKQREMLKTPWKMWKERLW